MGTERVATTEVDVPWATRLGDGLASVSLRMRGGNRFGIRPPFLAIVSSHQTKFGFAQSEWQAALLAALKLAKQQRWVILCAIDTPYFGVVANACERLNVEWMALSTSEKSSERFEELASKASHCIGILNCHRTDRDSDSSWHDDACVLLSNRVFAVHVRNGGTIAKLLEHRLLVDEIPTATTYVAVTDPARAKKKDHSALMTLLEKGAVGWLVPQWDTLPIESTQFESHYHEDANQAPDHGSQLNHLYQIPSEPLTHQPILSLSSLQRTGRPFLIHCTRSRSGPWPDQSIAQFHDEILLAPQTSPSSVLQTLSRILHQQRLIGTNLLRRSKMETVCFSEKPIKELMAMRRFQSHVGRWDWEPYGLMIDRDWLSQNGATKVTYISADDAKHMDSKTMAFCQVLSNSDGKNDWTQEQEWRLLGDLRLNAIPFEKCFVFVPSLRDAKSIQRLSRWPIVLLDA